jgi:2-hydroxycyclohexanecarboxyl-CoA dehydrogenase
MQLGLSDARVLVTGGGSNIGRGIVHGFAGEGARIVICDIDAEQADRVRAEAGRLGAAEAVVARADLAVEGAGRRVVSDMVARWGGIDVLVSNAGLSVPGFAADDTDRAAWQRMVDVNLFAAVECTQAALGPMRTAGAGALVYISSDAAFGQIRQAVYGTTKAGLIALARTVAKEHGRHGIRSNVVAPGLVLPAGADAIGSGSLWAGGSDAVFDERQIGSITRALPLRRLTEAVDVANAVVWVSSELAARQVTGQVLSVSGGFSMP